MSGDAVSSARRTYNIPCRIRPKILKHTNSYGRLNVILVNMESLAYWKHTYKQQIAVILYRINDSKILVRKKKKKLAAPGLLFWLDTNC